MEVGKCVLLFLLLAVGDVSGQTVQTVLSTCQQTSNRLTGEGFDVSSSPTEPVSGQFLQLCPESTVTCCNSGMEGQFENATRRRLTAYYPPSFITGMLDALIVAVNEDSYEVPDRHVTLLIRQLAAAVDVSHASPVARRLLELTATVKNIHDAGEGMADLSQQLKHLFSHLLVLNLRANTSLISTGSVSEGVVTCVAENVLSENVVVLETPTRKVYEQMRGIYLVREIVIEIFNLAIELGLEAEPFTECIRAYAELNHCQSCVPLDQVPRAPPCKNACKNVMIGCTAFFEKFRSFVKSSREAARLLTENTMKLENSMKQAVEALVGEIQKLNRLGSGQSEMDVGELLTKIEQCIASDSRKKRETRAVKVIRSQRRYIRQISGTVDTNPISVEELPHSVTLSLFSKVFEQLESDYFSQFDGLSLRLAEAECGELPTSQCWNQQSVGSDVARVVSPGAESLTSNPNLVSKGDTEIEINSNTIDDSETAIDQIEENINTIVNTDSSTAASAHTAVLGALVVMSALATVIFTQLL